jgi:siroheme synthase
VIENASLPHERQIRSRLDRLARDVTRHGLSSPAIIVIGEVARLNGRSNDHDRGCEELLRSSNKRAAKSRQRLPDLHAVSTDA